MAKVRRTQSNQAARDRQRRQDQNNRIGRGVPPSDGLVFEHFAHRSEQVFVFRRLPLLQMLSAGVWPKPVTQAVRGLMAIGSPSAKDRTRWDSYVQACLALIRSSAIVQPVAYAAKEIGVRDITESMCRPLFVEPGQVAGADQMILVSLTEREEMEERGEDVGDVVALDLSDITGMANAITYRRLGVLSKFCRFPADAMGGMAGEAVVGSPHRRLVAA